MSKVWIPKKAGHDYTKAVKFGQIEVILDEEVSPFNIDRLDERIKTAFEMASADDYIIPAGPPILNMLMVKNWPFTHMKLLLFHARVRDYVYRELYLER